MFAIKKIIVVIDDKEVVFEGEQLHVGTSTNAGVATALIIRDGDVNIAEFATWTYWREVKT